MLPRNDAQYDYLASEYIVFDNDGKLDQISHLTNNLYNMANYLLRQEFIKRHRFHKMSWLNKMIKAKYENRENMLYS